MLSTKSATTTSRMSIRMAPPLIFSLPNGCINATRLWCFKSFSSSDPSDSDSGLRLMMAASTYLIASDPLSVVFTSSGVGSSDWVNSSRRSISRPSKMTLVWHFHNFMSQWKYGLSTKLSPKSLASAHNKMQHAR